MATKVIDVGGLVLNNNTVNTASKQNNNQNTQTASAPSVISVSGSTEGGTSGRTNPTNGSGNTTGGNQIVLPKDGVILNISNSTVYIYNNYYVVNNTAVPAGSVITTQSQNGQSAQVNTQTAINSLVAGAVSQFPALKTNPVETALAQIGAAKNFIDNLLASLANSADYVRIYERKNQNLYIYSATVRGENLNAHLFQRVDQNNQTLSFNLKTDNLKFHEYIKVQNNEKVTFSLNVETENQRLRGFFRGTAADYVYSLTVQNKQRTDNTQEPNTLTVRPSNKADNPATIEVGNLKLNAWVEGNRLYFRAEAQNGDVQNYRLTLLNRNGERPENVGGNPFVLNLKKGESTVQYWTPVDRKDLPVRIRVEVPTVQNLEGKTVGSARMEGDNKVILTPNAYGQRGAFWSQNKVDLTKDFVLTANLYLGNRTRGADGIAFVIQNSEQGNNALGAGGGGLGYRGINNSFAVEFDTWRNPGEVNGNHLGFDINGKGVREVPTSERVYVLPQPLESGREIPVTFKWNYLGNNKARMTVEIFGNTYSYTINDITKIFGGKKAYVGFTAATGGERNLQYVSDIKLFIF